MPRDQGCQCFGVRGAWLRGAHQQLLAGRIPDVECLVHQLDATQSGVHEDLRHPGQATDCVVLPQRPELGRALTELLDEATDLPVLREVADVQPQGMHDLRGEGRLLDEHRRRLWVGEEHPDHIVPPGERRQKLGRDGIDGQDVEGRAQHVRG